MFIYHIYACLHCSRSLSIHKRPIKMAFSLFVLTYFFLIYEDKKSWKNYLRLHYCYQSKIVVNFHFFSNCQRLLAEDLSFQNSYQKYFYKIPSKTVNLSVAYSIFNIAFISLSVQLLSSTRKNESAKSETENENNRC